MSNSLVGLTVVVTRPSHQAQSLCDTITQQGGSSLKFPVIEIQPSSQPEQLQKQLNCLAIADFALFISANAVEKGLEALGGVDHWPHNIHIGSVGAATAAKLEEFGLEASLVAPEPFNSEALLSLSQLTNLSGKNICIFRGQGGRELLAETLRERGANVEYIECYQRVIPDEDPYLLYQCWKEQILLIIVVTSNESLANLVSMIDESHKEQLLSSQLLVVSSRAKIKAEKLGFTREAVLASSASENAIVEAIQQWKIAKQ